MDAVAVRQPPDAVLRTLNRGSWVVAGLLVVLLLAAGGRYGFHRDELYFIEGGHHLDWAQPDNPMTVPLLAAAWHDLVGGSLLGFRVLPALVAGARSFSRPGRRSWSAGNRCTKPL